MKRWAVVALTMLGLLGALLPSLASCEGEPPDGPTREGGRDARPLPTSDARPPAPDDATSGWDGAFEEAGAPPLPGEWSTMPGTPDRCGVLLAKDPAASVPRFPWQDCSPSRPGCAKFLGGWSKRTDLFFDVSHFATPFEDARGRVHISYSRSDYPSEKIGWQYAVVQDLHGDPEVVIAGPLGPYACNVLRMHASAERYAAILTNSNAPVRQKWVLHAAIGPNPTFELFPIHEQLGAIALTQSTVSGPGFVLVERTAGGPIHVSAVRYDTKKLVAEAYPPPVAQTPVAVPGGYFSVIIGPPNTLAFVPADGSPPRTVVTPAAGRTVTFAAVDRADANRLYWYETVTDTDDTLLVSSPFATTAGALVRRIVARLPKFAYGVVNRGIYATFKDYSTVRLIRVSDGLAWDVARDADPVLRPLWVNDDYVWSTISYNAEGQPGFPRQGGVVRLPRPKAPPDVPNGL